MPWPRCRRFGPKCTALHGVPTMFIAMLDHPNSRITTSSCGPGSWPGSPCPVETMRRVMDRMHMSEITIAYGMTETSPLSFQSPPTTRSAGAWRPSAAFIRSRGQDHRCRRQHNADRRGRRMLTRGYGVMRGYWDDPERSAEAIDPSGWMHSGDTATIDEQGYCAIVGRLKDMLIRGGENIYPREVEEFLYSHPAIADISGFRRPEPSLRRGTVRMDPQARRREPHRRRSRFILPRLNSPLFGKVTA